MAESGHKTDFPDRNAIRDFLRTIKPDAPAMFRELEGVSLGGIDKWYRDAEKGGTEISATNLLRVVLSFRKVPEFAAWLTGYASPVGETTHTDDDTDDAIRVSKAAIAAADKHPPQKTSGHQPGGKKGPGRRVSGR